MQILFFMDFPISLRTKSALRLTHPYCVQDTRGRLLILVELEVSGISADELTHGDIILVTQIKNKKT